MLVLDGCIMQEIVQIEIELSLITANWPKPRHPSTLVSRAADRWTLAMGMKQGDLCNFCIFDLDMACPCQVKMDREGTTLLVIHLHFIAGKPW